MNKKILKLIFWIAAILGSALLVMAFFMPYLSANPSFAWYLRCYPYESFIPGMGFGNGKAIDISLLELSQIYAFISNNKMDFWEDSAVRFWLITIIGGSSVACGVFAALKKFVQVIVFSSIEFFFYLVLCIEHLSVNLIQSYYYGWGFANSFFYIGTALAMGCAIAYLALQSREKKLPKEPAAELKTDKEEI